MSAGEDDTEDEATVRWLRPRIVQGRIRGKPVKYTRASRKHKIGRAHVRAAMEKAGEPSIVPAASDFPLDRLLYVGEDDRGVELEILAIDRPDCVLVIHVMPTALRGRTL